MKKIRKIEDLIVDFILNHYLIVLAFIMFVVGIYCRYKLLNYESVDYILFLKPWFDSLKLNGGIKALASYTGDYNAPYVTILALLTYLPVKSLYSIKIVSIIFDIITAVTVSIIGYKLINTNKKEVRYEKAIILFVVFMILPTIIINGAFWAQCDIIYSLFAIISIYFLMKEKNMLAFIFLGISFSFKLQSIFIIPVFLIIYAKKRNFSIVNFLIIPIMNIIMSSCAIIMGKSIKEIFKVYLSQTSEYTTALAFNFPNLFSLINFNIEYNQVIGIVLAISFFAIILYYIIKTKKKFTDESILLLSIISIMICTFFLPFMHERYMFLAEILLVIYAIIYKKYYIYIFILQIYSLGNYFSFLSEYGYIPSYISSIVLIYIIYRLLKDFLISMNIIKVNIR